MSSLVIRINWFLFHFKCEYYSNLPLAWGKTRNNSPLLVNFKTLELQYPSAMKMSPVEAMATEVGWHNVLYPLPFSNLLPKVNDALGAPGENCLFFLSPSLFRYISTCVVDGFKYVWAENSNIYIYIYLFIKAVFFITLNTWCMATSVTHTFPWWSIVMPWGM